MATKRKIRRIKGEVLTDYLRFYLETGKFAKNEDAVGWTGKVKTFQMRTRPDSFRDAWAKHRSFILKEWRKDKRKGKPWGAKIFDK